MNEQQAVQPREQQPTLPAVSEPMTTIEKTKYAATVGVSSLVFLEALHAQGPGVVLAGLAAYGAWYFSDEIRQMLPKKSGGQSTSTLMERAQQAAYWLGTGQRAVTGHAVVDAEPVHNVGGWQESDDDIAIMPLQHKPGSLFTFSDVLTGFVPSINKIFVGRTMDGKDIFVPAEDLCHVALAGKTGGGKGSLMRLLMVQLCHIGASVLLLNPHYMKWVCAKGGKDFDEDWTPFEGGHPHTGKPYLMQPPVDCMNYPTISNYLQWSVKSLLAGRKEKGSLGGQKFKPFFLVIDEWPAIVSEIKEAAGLLSKLLREGRKYNIFVIVASQDFQVKTIGVEGGSIRDCFLTVFYTGGDRVTANNLLHEKPANIDENQIGKGVVMLRCTGTQNEPMLVRVPFVDNEAVYRLLGPSTFKQSTSDSETTAARDDQPAIQSMRVMENGTMSRVIHQVHASQNIVQSERETDKFPVVNVNGGMPVNEPEKPTNGVVNADECLPALENNSPAYTHEEEIQVLLAYAQLLQEGKTITRTGMRDLLGWNNKQYARIIKPVCDKRNIGSEG